MNPGIFHLRRTQDTTKGLAVKLLKKQVDGSEVPVADSATVVLNMKVSASTTQAATGAHNGVASSGVFTFPVTSILSLTGNFPSEIKVTESGSSYVIGVGIVESRAKIA